MPHRFHPSRNRSTPLLLLLVLTALALTTSPAPTQALLTIHEYPVITPNALPYGAALGPDGNVWFTEFNASQIGKITTSGTVTEYPTLTPDAQPEGITAGPDGDLWFTEAATNKIGKITTSGAVTEYSIPTANSGATGITTGPDGALWFTEFGADRIGRMTTSGSYKSFKIPTKDSGPVDITTGSNGNLWFTEYKVNQVAQVTTGGSVTEYGVGAGEPYAIAPGPDGNLYFTEAGGNDIERITTAGSVTGYFPIPTSPGEPFGISPGPDGDLWFTEYEGSKVASLSTGGTITETPTPTENSEPFGITPGGDGDAWFTESAADKIGTFVPPNLKLSNIYYIPNRFFIPNITKLAQQGDTVSWVMLNPGLHGIQDASGMGLYETPNGLPMGESFSYTFIAAGSYRYDDPFDPAHRGQVRVPITVQMVVGAVDTAQVTWASADPPAGYAFDVQVELPGSTDFIPWQTGVTSLTEQFGPNDPLWAGPGTYRFRALMENTTNGAASGYSAAKAITLS